MNSPHPSPEEIFRRLLDESAVLLGAPQDAGIAFPDDDLHREILLPLGVGLLAIDANRARDAVASFERAAAIDSNNASYWANLGNARRASGDRAGAEQAYRRALEADARTADAANGLGVLLVEANRPAEAAPWFERAVAAAPDLVEARLNLGIALQSAGDAKRAADAYRLVLAARGDHPHEKDAARKLLAALGARR